MNDAMISVEELADLTERIGAILHGHDPTLQGAVLADLLAMWLAGHFCHDSDGGADRKATDEYREVVLDNFIACVCKLIPPNEAALLARTRKGAN